MEEVLNDYFVDFIMTALGTAVFTLIGFVWKISHKVSALEKRLETEEKMRKRDASEFRKDIDTICANVDKNREWTTSRMMSIVRDAPK